MSEQPLNHKQAERLARAKWGPLGLAVRASDRDPNCRYRLGYMVEHDDGVMGLQMAGMGKSWESAFASAELNPVAKKWEEELRSRLQAKFKQSMQQLKEAVLNADQASESAGSAVPGGEASRSHGEGGEAGPEQVPGGGDGGEAVASQAPAEAATDPTQLQRAELRGGAAEGGDVEGH